MPGSAVIDTAIGLVLIFALLALFCSAICEFIASALQMRARYLLAGLRLMLDAGAGRPPAGSPADHLPRQVSEAGEAEKAYAAANTLATGGPEPEMEQAKEVLERHGLTLSLFGHPLLQSLQFRRVSRLFRRRPEVRNPSYLSPQMFTRALLDTLTPDGDGTVHLDAIQKTVDELPADLPARKSLQTLLKRAEGDLTAFERSLEQWYDEQMGRVSGWYKRWARLVLAGVGLTIALLANVDTIQVAHNLYLDQPLRQAVLTQADAGTLCQSVAQTERQACADRELAKLGTGGLPVGWQGKCLHGDFGRCFRYTDAGTTGFGTVALKIAGLLITAFAVSFGAPFWFESLSKLGSLRAAGPRPPAARPESP